MFTAQVFQFHKGTIRTNNLRAAGLNAKLFQFHKGTIRTKCTDKHLSSYLAFQFHKGTIRTTAVRPFSVHGLPISIP